MGKSSILSGVGAETPRPSILENTVEVVGAKNVPGRGGFQEHNYARAELCGLAASDSCSSKVWNGLASV